jgi:hypothetical protein
VPASVALGLLLGLLLGALARLGGALLGPDQLRGLLQLLDHLWPSEVAAERRVRDLVRFARARAMVLRPPAA